MALIERTLRRTDAEIRGSAEESDRRPRYVGRYFSTASALPLHEGLTRPGRILALVAAIARRPRRLVALAVLLLRTRAECVFVSWSARG